DCLGTLNEELQARGIRLRPHAWMSSEWFSPADVPGIAIPFYLAHPRLMKLEKKMMLEVEGGTWSECMAILRHEAGHAVQHAYQLHRRREWQKLFGKSSTKYPESYRPNPASKKYVQHLRRWYAQSHPDEDFAETFAVWLRPRSNWRTRYAGWPALKKLEYVDELMGEIAGERPPVTTRERVDPLPKLSQTLGEHYQKKQAFYAFKPPKTYDRDLSHLFSADPRHRRALGRALRTLLAPLAAGGIHHGRAGHGERGCATGAALGRPSGLDDTGPQMAPRSRPRGGRGGQAIGQTVRHVLVVDPPPPEVRPRLLGGSLHGETTAVQHGNGLGELLVGELDRPLRAGVGIDGPARRGGDPVHQREPHPEAQARLRGSGARGEGQVHRPRVEYRQQADHPGQPRLGRPEEEQDRVGGVALGDVRRPLLPRRVEARQGVGGSSQLMADQELRAPGRLAGPALEQRDQPLSAVERTVERRQIGDLECDDDHPDGTDGDVDPGIRSSPDVDRPDGEERSERLEQAIGQRVERGGQHQPEAEDQGHRPEEELGEQGNRRGGGQDRVLAFVGLPHPGE